MRNRNGNSIHFLFNYSGEPQAFISETSRFPPIGTDVIYTSAWKELNQAFMYTSTEKKSDIAKTLRIRQSF